ncbi:ATP-binding protein [Streptomyces spectabilis]|uniref:AlbA family DNA-binding domain-containing protein n=1 Tax=Streptomyces spectabilis TaxID=68270 RepID=UPI0033D5C33A
MPLAYGDVRRLASQPESETLEVLHRVPIPTTLARAIAAFANTAGGVILFGVRDDKPWPDRLVGIDANQLREQLDVALSLIDPPVSVSLNDPQIEGKTIGAVEVPGPTSGFSMVRGQAWVRTGERVLPATVDQIVSRVHDAPTDSRDHDAEVAQLVDVIVSQAGIIEELNSGQEPKNPLVRIALAGVVGVVLGALLMLLIV